MVSPEVEISVVIMGFNEVESLEGVVVEISGELTGLGITHELILVDDGSSDGTSELADRLVSVIPFLRVIHHPKNLGLGGVYDTGFRESAGRYVTFFPGDGQFPAAIIPKFLSRIEKVDVVLGFLPARKRSFVSQLLSLVEKLLYNLLFGYMPKFQGVLMFRRSILSEISLNSRGTRGWTVLMELILRAYWKGYKLESMPTEFRPRKFGKSKVNNWSTILGNLKQLFYLKKCLAVRG